MQTKQVRVLKKDGSALATYPIRSNSIDDSDFITLAADLVSEERESFYSRKMLAPADLTGLTYEVLAEPSA